MKKKKLFFILAIIITILITSCNQTQVIIPASPDLVTEKSFSECDATHNGITNGNDEISGPLKKEELEGSLVSVKGSFTITPEAKIESNSKHEKGAIVREFEITGDDLVEFSDNSHFLIENVYYSEYTSPDSMHLSSVDEDSIKYCISFYRTNKGDYSPIVIKSVKKKQIFSDSVLVFSENNAEYVFFKDENGRVKNKILTKDIPDVLYNNGVLRDNYIIQKIPLFSVNESGDTIPVIEEVVNYASDEAGYKFISPCGGIFYLSNLNIRLNKIYVRQEVYDDRELKRSNGYASPNDR